LNNGWIWVGWSLVVLHLFIPWMMLMSRPIKRSARGMLVVCGLLLVMRGVENFYMIAPSGDDPLPKFGDRFTWMDVIFPIGMGGWWGLALVWFLKNKPLMVEGEAEPLEVIDGRAA
jgi:hypothetical protein